MALTLLERIEKTHDILINYFPLHSALVDWGKDLESHLSEWIVTHPVEYQDALIKSFEAGCDIASTSTQAASRWKAEAFGLQHKVHEHNYLSAKLAREVMPKDRYLAGFVSTTNPDFLEPVGSMKPQEVYDGYQEQISALLEGGVDLIMVVGNHVEEGVIAIQVAKDLADIPVIAHNVFYSGKKGFRTMMGLDPMAATARLMETDAEVIGASCGLMKRAEESLSYYEKATLLVKEMKPACHRPLSIQPNAGLPQLIDNKTIHPATPKEMAKEAPLWIAEGARILGGCCGTSLEHYQRLSAVVREINAKGG